MLTLDDIRRRARSRLDDLLTPYLWSDQDLLDYINDSLRDACIQANLVIEDDIAIPFTQKADLTWNNKYALSSGILDVKAVYLASRPNYTLQRSSIRRREDYFSGRVIPKGSPTAYALDQTQAGTGDNDGIRVRSITFLSQPTAADTAYMDVSRLPALLESGGDVPEIDEIWHPDLIYGVCGYAYLKRDTDTFDPKKSAADFARFEEKFGPRLPAVVLRERQTAVPLEMYVL